MAQFDIMPFDTGAANASIRYGRLNAAETFRTGEPIFINNDGEVAEFPFDDTEALVADIDSGRLAGIAAQSGDIAATSGDVGASNFANFADNTYPNAAPFGGATTGDLVSYWPMDEGIVFITPNIQSTIGTDERPTGIMVGEMFQLTGDNTSGDVKWVVESSAGLVVTNVLVQVLGVLDANKAPVTAGDTTTGVWMTFLLSIGFGGTAV